MLRELPSAIPGRCRRRVDGRFVQHHLMMPTARRNHRETIGLRCDAHIQEERSVIGETLRDRALEFSRVAHALRTPAETACNDNEIRQRSGIAVTVACFMVELLPLPD